RKLAISVGLGDEAPIHVMLGGADARIIEVLQAGSENRTSVKIDYYAYGRDQRSERIVDPYRVYIDDGQWYLYGHCHRAGGERLFRVDRIDAATSTAESFEPPAELPETAGFAPSED